MIIKSQAIFFLYMIPIKIKALIRMSFMQFSQTPIFCFDLCIKYELNDGKTFNMFLISHQKLNSI